MCGFSIVILTLNEEINIRACIESVPWCDDIVVLDSCSTDRTVDIAKECGARVYQNKFEDFGQQRNFALDFIDFKYDWLFHLDADERFNDMLKRECETKIALNLHSAYWVPNRIIFLGKWIPRCTQYPYPQVRLIKIGEVRFAKAGHGQKEDQVLRGIGSIDTPYDHYNFSKGINAWLEKHIHYASEEAELSISLARQPFKWKEIFSANPLIRRRAQKRLHVVLPFRWLCKFLYLYVLRMGFLDGVVGFNYCMMIMFYDFLITLKIKELRRKRDNLPI
ncbi:glycosyltransferase family 2 protein [Cerasicoccus fimbriatus]|uniref:glycosyltransferase family 2 protein n=1 Tax=Cerasicoccus fimbriatus TaxID=3014554 RepID=UPI0022B51073|nr:glycosyltransferase family 2 protein [Cerasicoccus sp. TK19100]